LLVLNNVPTNLEIGLHLHQIHSTGNSLPGRQNQAAYASESTATPQAPLTLFRPLDGAAVGARTHNRTKGVRFAHAGSRTRRPFARLRAMRIEPKPFHPR
jgi:hypothetical protein